MSDVIRYLSRTRSKNSKVFQEVPNKLKYIYTYKRKLPEMMIISLRRTDFRMTVQKRDVNIEIWNGELWISVNPLSQ